MSELDEDTSRELAAWLKDVGRRKWHPSHFPATGERKSDMQSSEDVIRYLEELTGRSIRSRDDVRRCFGELWARDRDAGRVYRRRQIVKEAAMLLCLVAAYIQYHFWDVNLQIARLPSTIVFVPAEAYIHASQNTAQASPVWRPRALASVRGL